LVKRKDLELPGLAKKLSMAALSRQSPFLPMLQAISWWASKRWKSSAAYWPPCGLAPRQPGL
jgi:hypothetical protein